MKLMMNLRTAQTVTPQMITAMNILQCSSEELDTYLEAQSYENPMIDLQEQRPSGSCAELLEKYRWLRQNDRQNQTYYAEEENRNQWPASDTGSKHTLKQYLHAQLLQSGADSMVAAAADTLIALLTDDGYLSEPLSALCRLTGCTEDTAEAALALVQAMDPPGVGARDLRECLLLQLKLQPDVTPLALRLVSEELEHLGSWSPQRLALHCGVPLETLLAEKRRIAALSPHPGSGFAGSEDIQYITPDVALIPEGDGFRCEALSDYSRRVSINPEYLRMLQTSDDPEVQNYLRGKLLQIQQLMEDLANRQSTILRCAQAAARWQNDYFHGGQLRKMTLLDIAGELGVHESTVSRTIRGKYIQCQNHIVAMSDLFSRSVGRNEDQCQSSIKSCLSEAIRAEDKRHPLSDQKLSELLEAQRISISRRTVAKYRLELGIPSASARKIG